MKFGSVRFFKRLIIACFAVLVALPLVLAVVFGTLYAGQRDKIKQLEAVNWALAHGTGLPEGSAYPPDTALPPLPPQSAGEDGGQEGGAASPSFNYQALYPDLYAERPETEPTEGKICYLTFDDGPSANTLSILKTLDDYGVKATFFATGEAGERDLGILRQAAEAGHTVGVHTYSHQYSAIYASPEAFLEDFYRMYSVIADATGAAPGIFRFPGGSINAYNQKVYAQLVAEMTRRGFVFFDWNVAGSDAVAGGAGAAEITANVLNGTGEMERIVVLLHDRLDNATTAAALPAIIEGLAQQGYAFAPLGPQVEPVTFFYQP